MPNKNYIKGVRKERKIVNYYRSIGWTAFRSAGSHSKIDVVAIDEKGKKIKLFQCKPDSMSDNARMKIYMSCTDLSGLFDVEFEVV